MYHKVYRYNEIRYISTKEKTKWKNTIASFLWQAI